MEYFKLNDQFEYHPNEGPAIYDKQTDIFYPAIKDIYSTRERLYFDDFMRGRKFYMKYEVEPVTKRRGMLRLELFEERTVTHEIKL